MIYARNSSGQNPYYISQFIAFCHCQQHILQATEEKIGMTELQTNNRRILCNLLPAHVAAHFIDNQNKAHMVRINAVSIMQLTIPTAKPELPVNGMGVLQSNLPILPAEWKAPRDSITSQYCSRFIELSVIARIISSISVS